MDLELPASAKHKVSGIAVTWDAEHIFFLPASAGEQIRSTACTQASCIALLMMAMQHRDRSDLLCGRLLTCYVSSLVQYVMQ